MALLKRVLQTLGAALALIAALLYGYYVVFLLSMAVNSIPFWELPFAIGLLLLTGTLAVLAAKGLILAIEWIGHAYSPATPAQRARRAAWTIAAICSVVISEGAGGFLGAHSPGWLAYATAYNGWQLALARYAQHAAQSRQAHAAPPPDKRVVAAHNDFGFRLLSHLSKEKPNSNLFFSPASVSTALALTSGGARGATRDEMLKALGLNDVPDGSLNEAEQRVARYETFCDPKVQVDATNSLWTGSACGLVDAFAKHARDVYGAQVEAVDLASQSGVNRINRWTRGKTHGRLGAKIDPVRGGASAVVLTNAMYFHGEWATKFKKANTEPAPFHLIDGSETSVLMMYQRHPFGYLKGDGFQAVRLPYGAGSFSMVILLPNERDGLPKLLPRLTGRNWRTWMSGMRVRNGNVLLPRFGLGCQAELIPSLKAMGVRHAFDADADLTGICSMQPAWIEQVCHSARIDVDEEGTTAAAITIEVMRTLGIDGGAYTLRVDHPFFCAIVDDRTGLVLFAGAVYNPQPAHPSS